MAMNADLRRAELEIQAWTVVGTLADDAKAGLSEAYRDRYGPEKDAFVAALINRIVDQPCASSNVKSAPSA